MTLSLSKGRGEGVITHWRAHFRNAARDLAAYGSRLSVIELRSLRQVREFLAGLATDRERIIG